MTRFWGVFATMLIEGVYQSVARLRQANSTAKIARFFVFTRFLLSTTNDSNVYCGLRIIQLFAFCRPLRVMIDHGFPAGISTQRTKIGILPQIVEVLEPAKGRLREMIERLLPFAFQGVEASQIVIRARMVGVNL